MVLQGDALFQMGKFEHALVIYHRGNRLRNGTDDDFRVGIQKATTSINNCLKNVRIVRELPDKRRISTWSFKSGKSGPEVDIFTPNAHPFKDDISGLKKILAKLSKEKKTSKVEKFTGETLEYLESRETLWKSQSDVTASKNHIVDFSPENLEKFYVNHSYTEFLE